MDLLFNDIKNIYNELPIDRFPHILRVTNYAMKIGKHLKLNKDEMRIIILSSFLHDVGYKDQFSKNERGNHHIYSMEKAKKELANSKLNEEEIEKILGVIKTHGDYEGCENIYQKILYDADKLDKTSFTEVIRRALIYYDNSKFNDFEIYEKIKKRIKNDKFHFSFSKKIAEKNKKHLMKAIKIQNKINKESYEAQNVIKNSLKDIFN
ncbi:MAG: HD domain-containing protein [Candidatus Woesearchaeota archaeon]